MANDGLCSSYGGVGATRFNTYLGIVAHARFI